MAPAPDLKAAFAELRERLKADIVGLDDTVRLLVVAVFCNGHGLLEGVPGLAKTRLISSLARLLDLKFSRIQFTPDLMPSDITGAEVIVEDHGSGERRFEFLRGPVFANIVLADEINRTPPKTQAALMEAMEERQVSSMGRRFTLDEPFFVLATQNPIEQEGTYPLPAAQLDRFLFNLKLDYPTRDDEARIARLPFRAAADEDPRPVLNREQVLAAIQAVKRAPVPEEVARYATTLVRLTRPSEPEAPAVARQYFSFGAGPRAAQALVLGAKALALLRGDAQPGCADVRALANPVLRHRLVLNFMGAADGVSVDDLIARYVAAVPAPDRPVAERTERRGFFSFLRSR